MNSFITFLLLIIGFPLLGQNIDSLGLDNNPFLNEHESAYLNISLNKVRGNFSFENKRIAFFTGKSATTHELLSKVEYFIHIKTAIQNKYEIDCQLLVLNQNEKIAAGEVDAFVIIFSKVVVTDDFKLRLIKEFKKNKKSN